MSQDNEGSKVTITTNELSKASLPAFMKFDSVSSTYTIKPSYDDKPGTYQIEVKLTDAYDKSSAYQF